MLARVIELSIRHRVLVLGATAVLAVLGAAALAELPFDAFPDTTPVQVAVNTVAPALAPLEVERQITFPLEQAMGGLPGVRQVRSVSKFGFSQLVVLFEDGTDIYRARQVVAERLPAVALPDDVGRPALGPMATGLGEVFQYLVRSDRHDTTELRTLHDWVVRPQMLSVPGVAEINTWGGHVLEYQAVVEPERLAAYGLNLDDVAGALERDNASVGGGLVTAAGTSLPVQGTALAAGVDDLGDVVIGAVEGVPVRVRDVARVREGHQVRRGAVTAGGEGEAVLGLGFMLMGENSREVTRRLEQRLAEVERRLPEGVALEPVYSRTQLVDEVLRTVRTNLFEGALLVVAVLFAFLGNLRAGLIVASAIPLSMLFAFDMMLRFGVAGSLMSLGAIDFGLIVDSSVIMVENAAKRLGEDATGRSVREVVRDAALEVRRPTLFGELVICSVYLPILALEGVEGRLFRPMALTVIFALLGSMLLSVTVMPALASLVLKRGRHAGPNRLVRLLTRAYRPMLGWAIDHRRTVLASALVAVLGAGLLAGTLGSEFVPRLSEMAVTVNTVRLAGVSLEESVRYGTGIERLLLERFPDEVEHVWTRTGTGEVATDPMGMELSDVFVTLAPRREWTRAAGQEELVAQMRSELEGLPGMRMVWTQPIEMRVNEMVAGIRADLGITVSGDDFSVLESSAETVRAAVAAVPGAADVAVDQLGGAPVVSVEVDRAALSRHGLSADAVLDLVEALGGLKVGQVRAGQTRFDVAIRLPDRFLDDPARLATILVTTPDGLRVPLGALARVRMVDAPPTITREWGKRRVAVQANAAGRDVGSFVADVRRAVDALPLPAGTAVRYGGQFEHLERARARLLVVVPVALMLVFGLLYVTYGTALDAARVFTGVPFAAVGGVAALALRGLPFSISAAVGFIALSGVAVLGDMVLVSTVQRLRRSGMEAEPAVRSAAVSRLRPVLMTALVASLGFLPMALNTGVGAEVQRPLATVVIGGIATSTLATLVVLPVLYLTVRVRSHGD